MSTETITRDVKQSILFADGARGIYIPQHFAESHSRDHWIHINAEDLAILESGPDHEFYWDAWDNVLNDAETIDGGILHQDGDLWVIWPQLAIDVVNEYCEQVVEYETSHVDAGDNYAYLVAESWCGADTDRLIADLSESPDMGIDPRWSEIDPDQIADMALDSFVMTPGHVFSKSPGIVLDSYPVGEIEISLDGLGIDQITMDQIRESCDAYISETDTDLAYVGTDSAWSAVLDVRMFNEHIAQHFGE